MSYNNDVIERAKLNKQLTVAPFAQSFRWCNNDCDFCYLKTTMFQKPPSIDDFNEICNNVIKWFEEYIEEIPKDINVMFLLIGGELYCLNDEYYDALEYLIKKCNSIRKIDNIALCSNLLLNKDRLERMHRFYDFCSSITKTDVNTSYDIEGRFRTEEKCKLWFDNFSTIINTWNCNPKPEFEMVLTKSSITKYINDEDTWEVNYFKKTLEYGYKIDFCTKEYQPNSKANISLVPSNDDLFNFFKKLIDDYWNRIPLVDLYDASINQNDYFADSHWHMPASSISFGLPKKSDYNVGTKYDKYGVIINYCDVVSGIVPWDKDEGDNSLKISGNEFICVKHPEIVSHYFNNIYGCGSCKYKKVCNSRHFFTLCYAIHKHSWSNNKCYVKKVFKYVEDKKNDI